MAHWNASESGHPFVFMDGDARSYLFFQGNNDMGETWYISKVCSYLLNKWEVKGLSHELDKIMIISETFPPDLCGVADHVDVLAQNLSMDYDIHIVTRVSSATKHLENITVHQVITSNFYILGIIKLIREVKPKIVEVHLSYSGASLYNYHNYSSMFNSYFLRLFTNCTLICTVHELNQLHHCTSTIKKMYRKLKDYFNTSMYHFYFYVDKEYTPYLSVHQTSFLEHFSNLPTVCDKTEVNTKTFLYFGTMDSHKEIQKLLDLFQELYAKDEKYRLIMAGGISKGYSETFYSLLNQYPKECVEYIGRVNTVELTQALNRASYAIFPFKVTDKNSSVLAMIVNGMVVIAESDSETEFSKYGNNYYSTNGLSSDYINQIVNDTLNKKLIYINNHELIKNNVKKRKKVYEA